MDQQKLVAIVNEELQKAYQEIISFAQFKFTQAGNALIGRLLQEGLDKERSPNEKV